MAQNPNSLRVLVVDDNSAMRSIVTAILRNLGIVHLEDCTDGGQALTLLRDWRPDIVIVDFNMSPIDGVEFTRIVRQTGEGDARFTPIIMLTGHSERSRVEEARDAGVNEFIIKPVTGRAIVSRLKSVIERPRPFVETESYFGPDRRRRDDPNYGGPRRRKGDS